MLFPEEDAPLLKSWVVKRLEKSSDADGDVLAEYVLALLRHEGSVEDVRKLCEAEVPDFLNEDPAAFVRDVFHAIQYRTYLPGGAPIASTAPTAQGLPYDDVPVNPNQTAVPAPNGSRKRTYEERGDVDMQDGGRDYSASGFKQARRGRGGRFDNTAGFARGTPVGGFPGGAAGFQAQQQQTQSQFGHSLSGGSSLSGGAPAFDPNSMEAFLQLQNFMPLPTMSGYQQQGQSGFPAQGGRRQLCRDYETKGYCARGNSCRFEHPTDSMFIPPQANEEYDPANASLSMGGMDIPPPTRSNQPSNMRGRHGRSLQDRRQNRRGRAPFSAEGPVTDKTKTTIVVESIPEEHFTEEAVRGFFSQFGNIVEVSMQPYKHLAIVKYDSWNAANAAYRSPKVIFENRFVKVFWYKEGDSSIVPPSGGRQGSQNGGSTFGEGSHPGAQGGGEEIDMEEVLRKQDEAQKVFLEKQQKAQEIERQREEIERKRQELETKQREERQKLLAALAKKSGSSASSVAGEPSSRPSNQTEALRAQLAALEAEAKQLGIDPDAAMAEDNGNGWTPGYRGGRGRGRGGVYPPPRGRGGFAPRASFRGGGFRGGRGGGPAAYAAYSLDNRPKKVAVTGADFTSSNNDEALRRYLFGVGEFTDINETPVVTYITFNDRKTAEKFYYGLANKQMQGIDGQLEVAWVNNDGTVSAPTPPTQGAGAGVATAAPKSSTADGTHAQLNGEDAAMADVGHQSAAKSTMSDNEVHIVTESRRDESQMDYDVADEDNEWND